MPRTKLLITVVSLLLWLGGSVLPASEGAVAFDSSSSLSAANEYPGHRGAGWKGRWEQKEKGGRLQSVTVKDDALLGDTGKPYLEVKGATEITNMCTVSIARQLAGEDDGPLTYPLRYEFVFRVEAVENHFRYVLFDAPGPQAATGKNVTWQISAAGGFWRVMDGGGNGGQQNEINTAIPIVPQEIYTFTIEVKPKERKWSVRISNGRKTFSRDDLNFRSDVPILGGSFHAGFSCADSTAESHFGFAIASIKITALGN